MNKAMIMCAGVGSRLEPLTKDMPKPLIPVANVPVLDFLLHRLSQFGISSVVANTYYYAEMIENRYNENNFPDMTFEFVREDELSGTAGGVKKCQFFFNEEEDFFVMSADGFHDVDLTSVYESHLKSKAIATMVLKEVPKDETFMYGVVVPDSNGFVAEFQEKPSPSEAKSNLINTGIYVFNYKIFNYIPKDMFFDFAKNVFPQLLASKEKINTVITDKYWNDIGTLEQYVQSVRAVLNGVITVPNTEIFRNKDYKFIIGQNSPIPQNLTLKGECTIGNNCTIYDDVRLINTIVLDNVTIRQGLTIENSIIAPSAIIKSSLKDTIYTSNEQPVIAN